MRILVVDKFNARRDPAQMDMYEALEERHTITRCSSAYLHEYLPSTDLLYLGIYHQVLPLNYVELFKALTCPVIIDQADNEDFMRRIPQMGYNLIKPPKVFLSRYLPHTALQKAIPNVKQLSWYVNPDRVKYNNEPKDIDVAFICSIYGKRSEYAQVITNICRDKGLKCFVGTIWGEEYYNILRRSKVFVAQCNRGCYTQKYIEASICGCTIVGDVPKYPESSIRMYQADLSNIEERIMSAMARRLLTKIEFADKDYFLKEVDTILNFFSIKINLEITPELFTFNKK